MTMPYRFEYYYQLLADDSKFRFVDLQPAYSLKTATSSRSQFLNMANSLGAGAHVKMIGMTEMIYRVRRNAVLFEIND
jgi:hypothetical protein